MSKPLVSILFTLSLCIGSYAQDSTKCDRVITQALELVKRDLKTDKISISGICFKNVSVYVRNRHIGSFYFDTSFVRSNFSLENRKVDCICNDHLYAPSAAQSGKAYDGFTLFFSPYFEDAVIVRVAYTYCVIYHDDQFSAIGTNYFYLLKFDEKGKIKKSEMYKLKLD